jgi:hypothetical protein
MLSQGNYKFVETIFVVAKRQAQLVRIVAAIIVFSVISETEWFLNVVETLRANGLADIPQKLIEFIGIILWFYIIWIMLSAAIGLRCNVIFIGLILYLPIMGFLNAFDIIPENLSWINQTGPEALPFIEIMNTIQLFYLSWKSTRFLKENGVRVGLFGANENDLIKLSRTG